MRLQQTGKSGGFCEIWDLNCLTVIEKDGVNLTPFRLSAIEPPKAGIPAENPIRRELNASFFGGLGLRGELSVNTRVAGADSRL